MRFKLRNELIPINILAILFILIVTFFPTNTLRIILSLPFIFFFPGYTAIAFLVPKKSSLSIIERVVLSIALSLAVVTLVGLSLSYTPWGISIYPIVLSVTIFIIITSALACYRRRRLNE
ncbi:MAG: DUF1616 domain-containing protein [Dehalococcoidales bacterium]